MTPKVFRRRKNPMKSDDNNSDFYTITELALLDRYEDRQLLKELLDYLKRIQLDAQGRIKVSYNCTRCGGPLTTSSAEWVYCESCGMQQGKEEETEDEI